MKIRFRDGRTISKPDGQEKLISLLYETVPGRALLSLLISPCVSKAAGCFLSAGVSRALIKPFIRRNDIDMSQYEPVRYRSYNEFFSRMIREGARPVDMDPAHLVAPCDSKLTVMPIGSDSVFCLKNTPYTVAAMLRDEQLAKKFTGGYALIFRLTVDDYHRYCYIADGEKGANVRVPGVFHTVNPIANDHYPIYKENTREYSVLKSGVFGDILMMEVGALLVGRIVNHHGEASVKRGEEKGYFQFGGSTVVLLLEAGAAEIDEDILANSREGVETVVRMGERIGAAAGRQGTTA